MDRAAFKRMLIEEAGKRKERVTEQEVAGPEEICYVLCLMFGGVRKVVSLLIF